MEYEFAVREQIRQCSLTETQTEYSRGDADNHRDAVSAHGIRHSQGGLEGLSGLYAGHLRLPADAVWKVPGAGADRADPGGLECSDARPERLGQYRGQGGERCSRRNGRQDAEHSLGESRTPFTGWENERSIFLGSAPGSVWPDWRDGGFADEDEEMDSVDTPRKHRTDIRVEFDDLSSDEVSDFFASEDNAEDEDIDTEYPDDQIEYLLEAEQDGSAYAAYLLGRIYMCGEVVVKDIPEAIRHMEIASARGNHYADYRLGQIHLFEPDYFDMDAALDYLTRSAQAGNESAAQALQRMAENSFLAITTNVLELIGGLCDIEPRRPIKDCTTLPQKRERRKWEQRM